MTPRMSVRAEARRLYAEMVGEGSPAQLGPATLTPDPSPQEPATGRAAPAARPGEAGEQAVPAGGEKADLMAHLRAMYEDSIVPVRDIARHAGVTERTLYKYARKQAWKPRYAWMPDGSRPPAGPARRRFSEQRERALQVAPAKGAGGRFIRRDDIGVPFAQGIKATDPAARAAAAQACAAADRAAARAMLEAECRSAWQGTSQMLDWVLRVFRRLDRFTNAARKAGRPIEPVHERIIWRELGIAGDSWAAAQRVEREARLALERFDAGTVAAPVTSACPRPSSG